jgi:putative Mg2+ transporter-C (MgtC) family protein
MFGHATPQITLEFIGPVNIYLGIGIQIIFALILGGIVGFDREVKVKAAGLKTNIMICIGATLYTTISMINLSGQSGMIDPNRVSAQIVSGIGFLGAGAIIQGRGGVTGLTTAATIWVVAAIGYCIGVGYPLVATLFSVTVLLVLKLINPLNKIIEREKDFHFFHIELLTYGSAWQTIENIFVGERITIVYAHENEHALDTKLNTVSMYVKGHYRAVERVGSELSDSLKVHKTNFRQVEKLPPNLDHGQDVNVHIKNMHKN